MSPAITPPKGGPVKAPPRLSVRGGEARPNGSGQRPMLSNRSSGPETVVATDPSSRLLAVLHRYTRFEIGEKELETELLPHMMAAAESYAATAMRNLPPFAHYEEVLSALYERCATILRRIDPHMPPLRIQQWIYTNFRFAVSDVGRQEDPMPKRKRAEVNRWKLLVEQFKAENGRDPTVTEKRELAERVVPPRTLKSNGRTEVDMIVNPPRRVAMSEVAQDAGYEMEADEALDEWTTQQALHIAAANLEDDVLFENFVRFVVRKEITEASIKANLAATLQDALARLGVRSL